MLSNIEKMEDGTYALTTDGRSVANEEDGNGDEDEDIAAEVGDLVPDDGVALELPRVQVLVLLGPVGRTTTATFRGDVLLHGLAAKTSRRVLR